MTNLDLSDQRTVRKAAKAAKAAERERAGLILNLMSEPAGRAYLHDILTRCYVFAPTFSSDPLAMAFNEGQRNIGLQFLNDAMLYAPDQYISMMREANDRHLAADRRSERDNSNGGRDDSTERSDDGAGEDVRTNEDYN